MFSSVHSVGSQGMFSNQPASTSRTSGTRAAQVLSQSAQMSAKDGTFNVSNKFVALAKKDAENVGQGYAAICQTSVFPGNKKATFYGYKTGKEMDMTVACPSAGNSLDLALILTLSGHAGQDKVESFVQQAQYVVEVEFQPKGSSMGQIIYNSTFGPAVQNGSSYDDVVAYHPYSGKNLAMGAIKKISIDNPQAGDYIVRGWPVGSGGVYGYIEGRQTRITVQ